MALSRAETLESLAEFIPLVKMLRGSTGSRQRSLGLPGISSGSCARANEPAAKSKHATPEKILNIGLDRMDSIMQRRLGRNGIALVDGLNRPRRRPVSIVTGGPLAGLISACGALFKSKRELSKIEGGEPRTDVRYKPEAPAKERNISPLLRLCFMLVAIVPVFDRFGKLRG